MELKTSPPTKLANIQIDTACTILGGDQYGDNWTPIHQQSNQKTRNVWNALSKKLFNRNQLAARTNTLLWNALIRSTLTYAIQTQDISHRDKPNINDFTVACIRQILHRYRHNETRKPQKEIPHATLHQTTTTSWIIKLRIMHMIRQTRDGWNIHHIKRPYAQNAAKLWQLERASRGETNTGTTPTRTSQLSNKDRPMYNQETPTGIPTRT